MNRWTMIAENKKKLDNSYIDPIHNVLDTPRMYRKTEYHASDYVPAVDENQLLHCYRRIRDAGELYDYDVLLLMLLLLLFWSDLIGLACVLFF